MSVYFERKLSTSFGDVCTDVAWYNDKTLAAACLAQSDGSYINVFDAQGNLAKRLDSPKDCGPVSCMAWHARGSLCVAWGPILCSNMEEENEVAIVESPHRATIRLLLFSQQGGRLISADSEGGLVGWNSSGRQLLTIFHHQFSDVITNAVFVNQPDKGLDLWGVARAAVAGDEKALDMFTNLDMFGWRPKTAGRRAMAFPSESREGMCFFAAAASGVLLYINETGRCEEVLDLGCGCRDILYRADKDQLLVLTEFLAIVHLSVAADGTLEEIMKVKLSGDTREVMPTMVWARSDTVGVNLGGTTIRLWNLDTGENTVLDLPESAPSAEHFTALASGLGNGVLCGGTNAGNLLLWRKADEEWESVGNTGVSTPVKQVAWGGEQLAVSTLSSLYLLRQHPLSACFSHQVGCIQMTGSSVMLYVDSGGEVTKYELSSEIQVHGLAVSPKYCLLFSDKSVVVYQYAVDNKGEISVQSVGTFQCQCEAADIFEESIIMLEEKRVTMRTMQGTVKQILFLVPTEGDPIVLGTFGHFVSVVTTEGVLRLWDISRREAKSHGRLKNLRDVLDDFGEAMAASCNSDGTKVALTIADPTLVPVNRLYILDVESDTVQWLDFTSGRSNDDENEPQDIDNKMIVSFAWDEEDPKLIVVHAKPIHADSRKESMVVCLWVSAENGILVHEKLLMRSYHTRLLSCCAPYVTLLAPQIAERVERITLGDFSGVSDLTPITLRAILSFSYNLAIGNMDLAFKSINTVTSESVWMNLAKNCVKTKRLDVALVCMGRMKNARVAHALRQAEKEPELDARVAILAIHVGMLEEAKALLKGCGRFDLLNKLHQSLSQWGEALQVAEESDRVHLRNTYHLHGKFLEQSGLNDAALENYEKADTHRIHGPRLLVDDPDRLKAYVDKSGDPQMLKWLAQYLESTGDMEEALQYYTLAKDFCSIVRVLCFLNNFTQASEIVVTSGDRAAAYHLARQYEAMEKIDEALIFFTKAGAFGNAIRICKEQGLTDKVWGLALQGTPRDQSDAAQFLLEAGDHHKAILLYQRAGMPHKALELAFSCGDYDALDVISHGMSSEMDPAMLEKLAEFFITNQQYSRAVDMLAAAGKFSEAVALCSEHNVQLTDEMAEKLNPTGPDRNRLLLEIGNCALAQGNYHLATKRFTQAGDKVTAMKALLKSGDTDKIIFLASVSREKDVYVMASNYLQALDWRSNPQLLNTIIQFYTKAKAHQALANFYTACANVEAEEYDDLDKAVVALGEAKRCLSRIVDDKTSRRVAETVERRIADVQQFVRARRAYEAGDRDDAIAICRQLLGTTDSDGPISRGRILALMIMHEKDRQNVRQLYEELRSVASDPTRYVSPQVLAAFGLLTSTVPIEQDSEIEFQTSF